MVLGKTEIDEVNEALPMNIPDSEAYDTFSGYVLYEIDRIPNEKEEIIIDTFKVTVEEKEGNRINKYVVEKLEKEQVEESESESKAEEV